MANFTLVIGAAPEQTNDHYAAWHFVQAALFAGHQVQLFFNQDGVRVADPHYDIPTDEWQSGVQWQRLLQQQQITATVCSAAAQRRGLLANTSTPPALRAGFVIGGLGALVEFTQDTDRLLQF